MINFNSATNTSPFRRIRLHFSSIVNGSLSPHARKEVTVKEFATFLGIEKTQIFRIEEGVAYYPTPRVLDAFTIYLVEAWESHKWPALVAWFEQSREHPKKYKFMEGADTVVLSNTVLSNTVLSNTVLPDTVLSNTENNYAIKNPLWEREQMGASHKMVPISDHWHSRNSQYKAAHSYLVALWELYVLDSLKTAAYPWNKESMAAVLETPRKITSALFNDLCRGIAIENGKDASPHSIASIIKMSPWPIEKFLAGNMQSVPEQFVERIRYWTTIQDQSKYSDAREGMADVVQHYLLLIGETK